MDYDSNSDDCMNKYLQKQLKHQRQLLHLELPKKTSNKILTLLELNGYDKYIDDDDNNNYNNNNSNNNNNHNNYDDGNDNYDDVEFENNGSFLDYGSIEIGVLPTPASETAIVAVKNTQKS